MKTNNQIKEIEKMNRETCFIELKRISTLTGKETEKELEEIYSKCLDGQGLILLNGFKLK
jgi:hypothetical protein